MADFWNDGNDNKKKEDLIILDAGLDTKEEDSDEELYAKMKRDAEQKAKLALMKQRAEAEALADYDEEEKEIIVYEENSMGGRRQRGPVSNPEKQATTIINNVKDEVDRLVETLESPDVDERNIEANRNEEIEEEYGKKYNFTKMVTQDVTEQERPKRWQENVNIKNMLDYIIYVFGHNHLNKELYKVRTKNIIKDLLMTSENIADYRHTFREEEYEALFAQIPLHFENKYGKEYLKEAFILLNIVYKYGEGAVSIDTNELIDLILDKNDILPATLHYDKPYTKEFWMDLSKFKIFSSVQNMCIEEAAIGQALILSGMINEKLAIGKDTGDMAANEMKALADTLAKLEQILDKHKTKADENKDSLVFKIPEKGLDYSSLIFIEEYKNVGARHDREFRYYISAFELERSGSKKPLGFLMDRPGLQIGWDNIRIFTDEKEVAKIAKNIERNESYSIEVQRMDINEYKLNLSEKVNEE